VKTLSLALTISLCLGSTAQATIGEDALRLRNLSLAELENEQPGKAEEILKRLVASTPDDPLPYANLAIATLRQQRFDEALDWIDQGLEVAPDQPELLAIKGEVLQWSGRPEEALPLFQQAASAAPDDVQIQYALLRQASTLNTPAAQAAESPALDRLRELRPENLVVLMQSGQQALAGGDRAAATGIFQRIEEVLWQAPAAATTLMEQILQALEANDLEAARVPALRLENVAKITPMFKEGLRELSPGVQGVPLTRFRTEPQSLAFGDALQVSFTAETLASTPTLANGLATGDFDGDQRPDWARLIAADGGALEVWLASKADGPHTQVPAKGAVHLCAVDLDNDGNLDLIAYAEESLLVFRGAGDGTFDEATSEFGLADQGAAAATVLDFDIEGDLDLATAGGISGSAQLFRNALQGPLEAVGERSFPRLDLTGIRDLLASDLDRDGDVDLLIAHAAGLTWLDNLRQGQFADRTKAVGLDRIGDAQAVASTDLDNDGLPDLVIAGKGIGLLRNLGDRFEAWDLGNNLPRDRQYSTLIAFDSNNDGRMDLAFAGAGDMAVAIQQEEPAFRLVDLEDAPSQVVALQALDLDQDCDLDLLAGGAAGLFKLENQGGDQNHCLTVRLQGLVKGNSKNNFFGIGSTVELRSGEAYQFHEVQGDVSHLALGRLPEADLLRVVWTNGVPQNRLQPQAAQRIVEEQVLKGSCPFVYARRDGRIEFVTDLLWGAPIGLPVAPGAWASTDSQELVKLPGVVPVDGHYELRITEELWEAAFFDFVSLWVVDHPADVEVSSSLQIVPGESVPERVLATRAVRPVRAWSDRQGEITEFLAARDEVYASPWRKSAYQGVATDPWSLTLDLGDRPGTGIRLLIDAWIFPTDASLNLALAQQEALAAQPPRLEVETAEGWQVLMPRMGFPAGKTKTMVIDTPALPQGSRRLRIVGTQWLSFDRIAWSTESVDETPRIQARLQPSRADLHFRGFSRMYRPAPNGPHYFDYAAVDTESPWLPLPGRYTRFGDVRELLARTDDRSVVMAAGDEIILEFDALSLPVAESGWKRTVFLESHGWDKDADRNTGEGQQVEPLPFRAMTTYPYGDEESFPDSALHRDYLENWLTREILPAPRVLSRPSP
jgi:tetratricopeptide (TPR) repeat protein